MNPVAPKLQIAGELEARETAPRAGEKHRVRIILAGAVGNVLEWYDFGLYGLLAPVLASLFFPGHDRIAALLGVYGGFAVGFVMRPVGAYALGYVADRVGRRVVLAWTVLLIGLSTVAVGLLPTYQSVGVWAPLLLIAVRLVQGFSVGGEFVDSVAYLVESAPEGRRGVMGSVANLGSTGGMLLAAAVAAVMTSFVRSEVLVGWVWRVPFLFGGVLASGAFLLRRHLPPTPGETGSRETKRQVAPLRQAIQEQGGMLFAALGFTSGYGIVNYLTMVLLPTYAREFGGVPGGEALQINAAGQALALFVVPLSGWLSDHAWTRRTVLATVFATEALVGWKCFELVKDRGVAGLWMAQLVFAFLLAMVMGSDPAMLAEQFKKEYRVSAHAVVFNIGIGLFGGTAPMVGMALIRQTSSAMAPAGYLILAACLAAISVLALAERSRKPIE